MTRTYFVRRPLGKQKTFSVVARGPQNAKPRHETVRDKQLDDINAKFCAGTYNFEQANALVEDFKNRLLASNSKPITLSENLALLEAYMEAEYADRDILPVSLDNMRSDLTRAIEAIGTVSLQTVPQRELQALINAAATTTAHHRRLTARLNQLWAFAKRDGKLKPRKPEHISVRYFTAAEVDAMIAGCTEPHVRTLIRLAFATGCRLGEIFALDRACIKPNYLYIAWQITNRLERRAVKNRKPRNVMVLPGGMEALELWLAVPMAERLKIRGRDYAEVVRALSGREEATFHDLRHSYAIEALRRGSSITQVALLLGDGIGVTERHYTGFAMTVESLEGMAKLFA